MTFGTFAEKLSLISSLNGEPGGSFWECARHVIDMSRLEAGMEISTLRHVSQVIWGRRASEQTHMQEDAFPVAAIEREKMYAQKGVPKLGLLVAL